MTPCRPVDDRRWFSFHRLFNIKALHNLGAGHLRLLALVLLCMAGLTSIANVYAERILLFSLQYPGIDKLAHYVLHMLLLAGIYALLRRLFSDWRWTRTLAMALLICLTLGMLDEAQQLLVAARRFDVFDVLANVCGCLSAAILIVAGRSKRYSMALFLILPLLGVYGLVQYSQHSQQYYNAGLVYIKNKNYTAARQAFLLAVNRGEHVPALFNELAWLELEHLHNDPAVSIQYSRRALAAQPDNADFLDTHGWALFMNGRYSQALQYLKLSYQNNRQGYCINYHLGATYLALNMHPQAIRYLRAQLALNHDDRFALKTLSLLRSINLGT